MLVHVFDDLKQLFGLDEGNMCGGQKRQVVRLSLTALHCTMQAGPV